MSLDFYMVPGTEKALELPTDLSVSSMSDGAHKLALQVVRFLLTVKGTHLTQGDYGCALLSRVGGNIDTRALDFVVRSEVEAAEAWLISATKGNVASEALRQINYLGSSYESGTLTVAISVLNGLGESVSITLPIA
jgi:hypothetical protein